MINRQDIKLVFVPPMLVTMRMVNKSHPGEKRLPWKITTV